MRAEESQATTENRLTGGGEIGALLRSHDWSQTPFGAIETWSNDLKTTVQTLLAGLEQARSTEKTSLEVGLLAHRSALSALHQADQLNAFQIKLADALRPLVDASEIQEVAARILGESLGATRVIYLEVEADGEQVIVYRNYTDGVAELSGRYRLEDYCRNLSADHQTGRTQIVADIPSNLNYTDDQKARYSKIDIAAHIDVPLIKNHRFVALLAVHQSTPRSWTETEVKQVEETAERTWAAVERARAEAALRQSEAQTRNILESIHEAFFALDENWRFTYLNPSVEVLLDRTLADLVGKNIWEEYPGLIGSEFEQIYRDAMHERVAGSLTQFYPDHDRWYEVRTYPAPNGISVYFRNVTEQIQAGDTLRDREAQLAAEANALVRLNEASSRLWRKLNLSEGLTEMLVATIELLGADMGNIQLLDSERGVLQIAVQQGFQPDFLDFFREVSTRDDSACGRTLRAGQRTIIEDVETDPPYAPLRPVARAADYRAVQSTPLLGRDGTPLGMLSTHWRSPHRPSDQDLRRLDLYVRQATDFIESIRAETALRRSEERYRTLFESIDQGFCLLEVLFDETDQAIDYRFVEINQAFEQQTGLVDAGGKTILELIPNFEPQWAELYGQVAKSGEAIRFEADIPSLNAIFDVYAFPSGPPGQNLVAALFANITDRKQSEDIIATDLANTRLLRDLSARLINEDNIQVLYDEIMAAAIALTKADAGTVQILEPATQELVLLASQGFDRTMTDHFYRVNASSNTSCGAALTQGTRTFVNFDAPDCNDPNGSLRMHVNAGYLSAQSTPLISRSGKAIGMVSTHWRKHHRPSDRELRFLDLLARQAADLIEQRQAEAERKQILEREQVAREEAERANRIKDEFLAVLSHELRSPLNPILGWTHLLQTGKLSEARRDDALKTIERNAKLQLQLIEDLLDISRIVQGKLSLAIAPVSLPFVISAALETVRLAAEAKGIQVRLDLDPAVSSVSGDAARLQQVLWNLLTNAVKFTPNGKQVSVELRQIDGLAQIRVIDTGKGINPEFLPYVFEYFRQEDGSTTRQFGGLGLGLAIVRQIVEMHGGTVRVESQGEGQGATFIVELPIMQKPVPIASESTPNLIAVEVPLTGIHILLVDDELDTREFQAFLLEQNGATVTAVASGWEALQVLEQSIPDLLLSDIGMAEIDGYMLLQQIRAKPPHQGGTIPAIALTAYAAEIDQQRALQVGFQSYITKPVDPETLMKAIASLTAAPPLAADRSS